MKVAKVNTHIAQRPGTNDSVDTVGMMKRKKGTSI
jgi:hypothetical protein